VFVARQVKIKGLGINVQDEDKTHNIRHTRHFPLQEGEEETLG